MVTRRLVMVGAAFWAALAAANVLSKNADGQTTRETAVPVAFSGGHETDPRDRGRPVVLIAAELGVPADVFREAFRHVRPAPAGQAPDPDQVRRNKAALLDALGSYGVTNERLDAVSNYYRYVRSRGELWPTRPARAYAVLENGTVTRFVVTDGGSGYSSPPTVTVPGISGAAATVQLSFTRSADSNGGVSAIVIGGGPGRGNGDSAGG